MDTKTKEYLLYGGAALGALVIFVLVRKMAPSNGSNSTDAGDQLGAPTINVIGGSNPFQWFNVGGNQPSDGGISASTTPIVLSPVISNYNTTKNSGCSSCSDAGADAYYASGIVANAAITAAMAKQLGYTNINGHWVPPGYHDETFDGTVTGGNGSVW